MKAIKAQINYKQGSSFRYQSLRYSCFPARWHFHDEYELLCIKEGSGKRFVGNGVEAFGPGDIILIGQNTPHFLLSDSIYFESKLLFCQSEVLQFSLNIFPDNMRNMPEFESICQLLDKSPMGVVFTDNLLTEAVMKLIARFKSMSSFELLSSMYKILHDLSLSKHFRTISTEISNLNQIHDSQNIPMKRTFEYLMTHFKDDISLDDIARYAGQNPSALCRNFKQNTNKTIFMVLNEIRIEFARKLLTNSDFMITDIAFKCGFQNISHFNHKFKTLTTLTPVEYRKALKI